MKPDPRNARKHPDQNKAAIRQSLEEVGPFRSIAIDGEDVIRAGNGVYEQAQALGLKVRVVEAAPDELIAVRRADLVGEKAVRAAILDNYTGESSEWNAEVLSWLRENQPGTVKGLWSAEEWLEILGIVPDFQPVGEDEQGRLDEKKKVVCPECGAEFTPK